MKRALNYLRSLKSSVLRMAEDCSKSLEAASSGLAELETKPHEERTGEPTEEIRRKPKRRKLALLLSYCGNGYYGMQINRGFRTIEGDIFDALHKMELIAETNLLNPKSFNFQRAARTDKGVSAARQICSVMLHLADRDLPQFKDRLNDLLPETVRVMADLLNPKSFNFQRAARTDKGVSAARQICSVMLNLADRDLPQFKDRLNDLLPETVRVVADLLNPKWFNFQRAARTDTGVSAARQICSVLLNLADQDLPQFKDRLNALLPETVRVMGVKRATKGFDAKWACDARTYSYTMPSMAFAHYDQKTDEDFRLSEETRKEVNDILGIFCGSHNFFNYTARREHRDQSSNRFVMECTCGPPFFPEDDQPVEFVTIKIKGQSFMLHQIRKMIGFCIAIVRGLVNKSMIQKSWESSRVDVPMAPGLGLVLEKVHYDHYDGKFGSSHASLDSWPECDEMVESFAAQHIRGYIASTERTEQSDQATEDGEPSEKSSRTAHSPLVDALELVNGLKDEKLISQKAVPEEKTEAEATVKIDVLEQKLL